VGKNLRHAGTAKNCLPFECLTCLSSEANFIKKIFGLEPLWLRQVDVAEPDREVFKTNTGAVIQKNGVEVLEPNATRQPVGAKDLLVQIGMTLQKNSSSV